MAGTGVRMYVVRSGTTAIAAPVLVALAAGSVKTVVSVFGTAATTLALKRVRVSFDSVAAADLPAVVEVGIISAAGTRTAFTPVQHSGSTLASVATGGYSHTVEPTYNRVFEATHVPVNNGVMEWWYPLGEEPQCDPSQGLAIRITAPAAVNCLASLLFSE